jgi:mannosyltransferase
VIGAPLLATNLGRIVSASLACALVAVLATFQLGAESLWVDEAVSVFVAWKDWPDLWSYVAEQEPNFGLYYLLLHEWIMLGDSEWAVRALSVVAVVATVPVLLLLGEQLFDRPVAFLASVLFGINAFVVAYAQEARPYALALFLTTLSSYLFTRAIYEPSAARWGLYVVIGTLAIYSHLFAAFVLVGHICSLFFLRRRDRPTRIAIVAYAAVAALSLPLLASIYKSGAGRIAWIDPPTIEDVMFAFSDLVGNGGRLLLLMYFVVCCLGLRPVARTWRAVGASFESWRYALVLAWLFIPVLLSLGVSAVQPIFISKYLIVSLPAVVLIASVGLASVRRRWIQIGLLTLVLVFAARGLIRWYGADHKEQWRAAAAMVLANTREKDAIVFHVPFVVEPFGYYVLRTSGGTDRAPQAISPAVLWNEDLSPVAQQGSLEQLLRPDERPPRLWVILSHDQGDARAVRERRSMLDALSAAYRTVSESRFIGIRVILFGSTQ